MCKKTFVVFVPIMLGISICLSACSDGKNCDDVELGCDGTVRVLGCSGGELYTEDCKDISQTALCAADPAGNSFCYEPCTTEGEENIVCIDHTSDPKSTYCEMHSGDTECKDVPEHRPNTWKRKSCMRNTEANILYWYEGSENDCFRDSSQDCCLVAGKGCNSGFSTRCDESTNTAIFCNNQLLVEHKSCGETPDPNDFYCGICVR